MLFVCNLFSALFLAAPIEKTDVGSEQQLLLLLSGRRREECKFWWHDVILHLSRVFALFLIFRASKILCYCKCTLVFRVLNSAFSNPLCRTLLSSAAILLGFVHASSNPFSYIPMFTQNLERSSTHRVLGLAWIREHWIERKQGPSRCNDGSHV